MAKKIIETAQPEQQLLKAVLNSHSSTVRFGAAACDDHNRLIGVRWIPVTAHDTIIG